MNKIRKRQLNYINSVEVVYVDCDNGSDADIGSIEQPYKTIGMALKRAAKRNRKSRKNMILVKLLSSGIITEDINIDCDHVGIDFNYSSVIF